MNDVADAAGVGRATVYRYFPNRDALVQALFEDALEDMAVRLDEAEIDRVPVAEGIARTARALVGASSKYAFLSHEAEQAAWSVEGGKVDECLGIPIRALLRRGIDDGTLRGDWSDTETSRLFRWPHPGSRADDRARWHRCRAGRRHGQHGVPRGHRSPLPSVRRRPRRYLATHASGAIMQCMVASGVRRAQLLRGVLDLSLLAVMSEGPAYGYEMTKRLGERGLSIVGEGSIYPLLGRLERDGLVDTHRAASNGGPPRKYYRLSPLGRRGAGHRHLGMGSNA